MRKLYTSMTASLDGFIADPAGEIDWTAPDEELHQFHNEQIGQQSAQVCGRKLYEIMRYWDGDVENDPDATPAMVEFAPIWRGMPKIVFSRTLERVEGNAWLARGNLREEIERLKTDPGLGEGDISVGGATLAAACMQVGLVDELRLFVAPVLLGGGTPYFPPLGERVTLRLEESRAFNGGQIQYLRYAVVR